MRTVFADTFYWIALANRRDQWHLTARDLGPKLGPVHIVTTDEVLTEFLAFFSTYGQDMRKTAVRLVRSILANPNMTVVPQTRDSFVTGLSLYESRLDKEYSLTDCISMEAMRTRQLNEVLTHDRHFAQEGFTILLTDKSP
jgi:uncharacterized protein